MINISKHVENMCPVTKGANHKSAPIPEEGQWITAKEIKDISLVFGESEQELSKEFGYFKANKLFLKMDYLIDDLALSYEDFTCKCLLADRYNFNSISVYPALISKAFSTLKLKKVKLRGLIDYPYGNNFTNLKFLQVKRVIKEGASEIGYTIGISKNRVN